MTEKPKIVERNCVIAAAQIWINELDQLSVTLTMQTASERFNFVVDAVYVPQVLDERVDYGNTAGHAIYRLLQIAGAPRWADLAGKTVRVRHDGQAIYAVGHSILDDWFDPKAEIEKINARSAAGLASAPKPAAKPKRRK